LRKLLDWAADVEPAPQPAPETDDGSKLRRRITATAGLLLLLVAAGWAMLSGDEDACLMLDGRSSLEAAELRLLVDGEEVYSRPLSLAQSKKVTGLLKQFVNQKHERFEVWIEITPGKHEVIAHVVRTGESSGISDTVVLELQPGETRRLRMTAGSTLGSGLSLIAN